METISLLKQIIGIIEQNMNLKQQFRNFQSITGKIAHSAGLDNMQDNIVPTSTRILTELEASTNGAKSLSDCLAYRYFDEEASLFFTDEGFGGFMMELLPIVGSDEALTKNLELFFNNEMPAGGWMQFLLIASNNIASVVDQWKSVRISENTALKKLTAVREKFLHRLSSDYKNSSGRIARNYKLYLIYTQKAETAPQIVKLKVFMQNLKQKLESINLMPQIVGINELISLVREIVELDLSGSKGASHYDKKYDPRVKIADQILTIGTKHEIQEDRIEHRSSKLASKCYFASELPLEFSLNEMIGLLGDGTRDNLSIPARFIISYTVANDLNKAKQGALVQKGDRLIDSSEQWYSRNNRDIKREATEWKDINDRAKNGERFLTEYFQVMITAQSDFLDEAEQSLLSLYNILDFRLEVNKHFQLPSMLSILPQHATLLWRYLSQFKLTRIALSSEVIAKLPIHGEFTGVPEPAMLLIGRRGQLFNWNPYYIMLSGNPNVVVYGPSGAGKSVLLQELTTSMMALNAKVFILDIGQSYKNICELLGGEIIQFGRNSDISLNPLAGFTNNLAGEDRIDAITYAKSIICSMCGAKGDAVKEAIVEKSISKGLETFGDNLDISKLAEIMQNMDENNEVAKYLSMSLFSYTKDGLYGRFFNSKKDLKETKFDKQITVFEFEEIKNNPLLLAVVLQIIGMQIFMQVLTGARDKKFVLIVDEAWMILDYAAKFLSDLARTIRKYGGMLVTCVQNFTDLQVSEHHRAILENSTWTVLLKQDEKGINAFKSSEAFKDKIGLIKSIRISKDKYAEALLCATNVMVVGRLVLDNYSKVLYSTDADIYKNLNELKASGVTLDDAVKLIAERKYGEV